MDVNKSDSNTIHKLSMLLKSNKIKPLIKET